MIPVQVVGLGMSPADLTPRALEIIREAQVLVGGRRLLDYFPEHRSMKIPLGQGPGRDPQTAPGPGRDQAGGGAGFRGPQLFMGWGPWWCGSWGRRTW